ncbi:MAG: nucleotidyltransferase family protein [Muricomes sp.]|uniref:nucleotidyltransferase family protein n=1 Tax=Faecalicatena contorta TaxID=39482 RepID=UPI002EB05F95|nr:nucleotidyltransferase family protein [Muricomes sp.]
MAQKLLFYLTNNKIKYSVLILAGVIMMKTGAVITAAGLSSRMHDFKPLMQIGRITMIERVILNFQSAGIKEIVVVTGRKSCDIEKQICHMGIISIKNPDYAVTQMFDSALLGMKFLMEKCSRFFLCPVDIPLFKIKTVRTLMDEDEEVVIPSYRGMSGHPILISSKAAEKLSYYSGKGGIRGAINTGYIKIIAKEVEDCGILFDANTQEDYRVLLEKYNCQLPYPPI